MTDTSDFKQVINRLGFMLVVVVFPWIPFVAASDSFNAKLGKVNWFRVIWVVPLFYITGLVVLFFVLPGWQTSMLLMYHIEVLLFLYYGELTSRLSNIEMVVFAGGLVTLGGVAYTVNRYAEAIRYRYLSDEYYLLPLEELYETGGDAKREKLVRVPRADSLLVMGNTQSGKTTTIKLLMEQLEQSGDDAFVVLDAKGDKDGKNGQYQQILEEANQEYVQLAYRNANVQWNIFREAPAYDEDLQEEAYRRIAQALFPGGDDKGANAFFYEAAQEVLTAVMIMMMRDSSRGRYPHNADLLNYFQENGVEEIRDDLKEHRDLQGVASQLDVRAEGMALSVYGHVNQQISKTFVGSFKKPGDFSIREYAQDPQGRKLLLNMPQSHDDVLEPLYRFFLEWSIQFGLDRSRVEDPDAAMYFVLDEFSSLPEISNLESLVNRGLEYNTRTIVGLQSYSQLPSKFGEAGGRELASGFSNAIMLRPNDQETIDFMRSRIGKVHEERDIQRGKGRFEVFTDEKTTTTEEIYPIDEQKVRNLEPGEVYIDRPGKGYLFGKLYQIEHIRGKYERARDVQYPWEWARE